MANKTITALEITSTHIKLAQSKETARGWLINKLLVRDIPANNPEDIVNPLGELIAQAKLNSSPLVLAIPRQFVTLRAIRFPSHDNREIEKMVELQITKQIPCPREDVVTDYLIVNKEASGYSQVLLVICQKDIVNRYLKILQGAHLKAEKLALSSQGICNWYQDFSARKNIREARPVVILDIDMKNTDICFYYKENLLFTRSVNFGILDMKEGKADILIEELHKTFSALQKEQLATDIAKIVITTAFEGSNFLAEKLKVEFNYLVESANPLNEISLEKELIVPLAVKDGGCSVTSILGLILEKAKNQINLLPIEVKEEQAQANKLRDLAFLGALLVLTLIFFILAMSVKIYKKERYLKRLDAILKEESPKAKKVEASIKKLSLVRDRLNPIGSSIDVIYELYNIIPDGVTLSIFSFDDGELITLQGVARKMSDVFNFQSILEKSPYFKNVEVKYASKRRVRQTEVTDFRISCVVDKEKIIRP